jgi:hypothetical protein
MNLTLSKLKQLIKEEMMHETQKALGIPHGIDLKDNPEVLYSAAMSFLGNNPNLGPGSQKRPEAELLMKMLTNTIQGSVQHRQMSDGDSDMLHSGDVEGYIASKGASTSPEETERMRRDQGKLKMAKRALGDAMGGSHRKDFKYKRYTDSRREFFKSNPDYQPGDGDNTEIEEAKKKKACKPSKGKRFAKRVDGKCRSYGQKGKAKGGGDRIRPGTKKGDAYCARSLKIKKCKNPPCANALSRKKWKCKGAKSQK